MRPFKVYEHPSFYSDTEDEAPDALSAPSRRSSSRNAITACLVFTAVVAVASTLAALGVVPMPALGSLGVRFMARR